MWSFALLCIDTRSLPTSLIQATEKRVPTDLYHRYEYYAQMQRHKTICNKTYDTPLKYLVMDEKWEMLWRESASANVVRGTVCIAQNVQLASSHAMSATSNQLHVHSHTWRRFSIHHTILPR